jgi:hypothetical protein
VPVEFGNPSLADKRHPPNPQPLQVRSERNARVDSRANWSTHRFTPPTNPARRNSSNTIAGKTESLEASEIKPNR